jgi:hypothetical protein
MMEAPMDTTTQLPDEEDPSRLLGSLLDFIALAIERPDEAASRLALGLTCTALAITLLAALLANTLVGVGFAAFYAATGWGLSLYLRRGNGAG